MNAAAEWIRTDENAVLDDVTRLGLDGATDYQMGLISDAVAAGDDRWIGITEDEIREELGRL